MRISDWSSDVCSSDLRNSASAGSSNRPLAPLRRGRTVQAKIQEGPMRILVIEDNQDIAANLGDFLEDRGHTVDFAADGITGLHLAVVHDFDAIVPDLNLPGMNGLEVSRNLRNAAHQPVIESTS